MDWVRGQGSQSTEQVPGQQGIHSELLLQKLQQKSKGEGGEKITA